MEVYKRGSPRVTHAELERSFESFFPFDTTVYVRALKQVEKTSARMTWYGVFDMNGHRRTVSGHRPSLMQYLKQLGLTVHSVH